MRPRELADLQRMKHLKQSSRALIVGILAASTWTGATSPSWAEAPRKTVSAFEAYFAKVESRLAQQHRSSAGFLADVEPGGKTEDRLHKGEVVIEKLTPDNGEVPGANSGIADGSGVLPRLNGGVDDKAHYERAGDAMGFRTVTTVGDTVQTILGNGQADVVSIGLIISAPLPLLVPSASSASIMSRFI